jgi:predicted transposase/invertase (TIGR01784 family)
MAQVYYSLPWRLSAKQPLREYAVGVKEGRAEGLSEGLSEGRAEAAKGFKAKGVDPQTIAEVTGLSLDEVLSL